MWLSKTYPRRRRFYRTRKKLCAGGSQPEARLCVLCGPHTCFVMLSLPVTKNTWYRYQCFLANVINIWQCEQLFSFMKNVKSRTSRTRLSHGHESQQQKFVTEPHRQCSSLPSHTDSAVRYRATQTVQFVTEPHRQCSSLPRHTDSAIRYRATQTVQFVTEPHRVQFVTETHRQHNSLPSNTDGAAQTW
jgi:sensor c-di-GMP phosphodiesterase-like protein